MEPEHAERAALPLSDIRVLAARNVSRGGRVDPTTHPEVQRLAASLRDDKRLLEPIGVRTLDPPAPRPDGGTYSHEIVYGYRRLTAAELAGWTSIDCVLLGMISDAEARRLNVLENLVRNDPSDVDNAEMFAFLAREDQITCTELARQLHSRVHYVEQLVRIVTRCPRELVDQWRLTPTPEVRRALDRISRIEGQTELETRRKMLDEWQRFLAERESSGGAAPSFSPKRAPRAMGGREIEAYRSVVDEAVEVLDAEGWRPISETERSTVQRVLQHVQEPRGNKSPLR